MNGQQLRLLAAVAFVAGTVAILLAEATWLRLASAVVLFAYVVLALFAIATPEFLAGDDEERP